MSLSPTSYSDFDRGPVRHGFIGSLGSLFPFSVLDLFVDYSSMIPPTSLLWPRPCTLYFTVSTIHSISFFLLFFVCFSLFLVPCFWPLFPERSYPHRLHFHPSKSSCVALQPTAIARGLVLYRLPGKGESNPPVSPTVWLCLSIAGQYFCLRT